MKFSSVKIFRHDLFRQKLMTPNILCNVCQPIPILVAKVWRQNLDYVKNLQVKYFTGENILIYGIYIKLTLVLILNGERSDKYCNLFWTGMGVFINASYLSYNTNYFSLLLALRVVIECRS